mgnify:CR=1 FL=1
MQKLIPNELVDPMLRFSFLNIIYTHKNTLLLKKTVKNKIIRATGEGGGDSKFPTPFMAEESGKQN